KLRGIVETLFEPDEAGGFAHPSGVIGNPLERNVACLTHFGEEAHDGALVFDLGLGDGTTNGEGVEHLPHRLWMALFEDVLDRSWEGGDGGLGAARPLRFYVLRYIKS